MSGRGRRATLPNGEHRRPQVLDAAGLRVTHTEHSTGRVRLFDFATLDAAPGLRSDLAELMSQGIGPIGRWKSLHSSTEVWRLFADFTRFLAAQGMRPESAAGIGPHVWAAWMLSLGERAVDVKRVEKLATVLREHPALPAATAELMTRRVRRPKVAEQAYPAPEFDQIKAGAAGVFRAALLRIRENRGHLERWRADGFQAGTDAFRLGQILDHIARTGIPPADAFTPSGNYTRESQKVLGGQNAAASVGRLFLNSAEAWALLVLVVATFGWNATSVAELEVPSCPDPGPTGPVVYRVELVKRRRRPPHGFESRNLTDLGAGSPGRLIAEAVEATDPVRAMLAATDRPTQRLIVWHSPQAGAFATVTAVQDLSKAQHHARGRALGQRVNLRRLRKTVVTTSRPDLIQHTAAVRDRVYVLPDPRVRAEAAEVIEQGVLEAVAAAGTAFAARLTREASDPANDTALCSCSDYTNSPLTAPGLGCRASFLLCAGCTNAVVTPRHLPRIAVLIQTLEALRTALPPEEWSADWQRHHQHFLALRAAPAFTDAEWSDALADAGDEDRAQIEELLTKGAIA